jgi:hypothetical protein
MDDEAVLKYMKDFKDLMEQTLDRVDAMEDTLYKKVLDPMAQLQYDYERGQRHDAFMGKHGEQLKAFNDKLKAIEGDDFDLAENTFNDYDESDHSIDEDEYVAALIAKVQSQIDKISKAFGGGNIEVESKDKDKDGTAEEVTVETDKNDNGEGDKEVVKAENVEEKEENGEKPESEENAGENADKTSEETAEDGVEKLEDDIEKAEESADEEGEEPIDSPEEVDADMKELEDIYNKMYKKD